MNKHELLVPAGNMDCLKQAIYNGCDAVYLACKNFGARKFANNFDNEEIIEAIKLCHLYGVKIYVTMNTLIKNNEVEDFLNQVRFLHKNGVDALIVQDFGMICLLREKFPNLEIHASTQANISSKDICELYYKLGVKRVVFSRELTIYEIDSIKVPIEKEAFIHGALCISYSGCCLMSSMLGGRSGNRGECAGSCRLPYSLKKDNKVIIKNKYLLSTKELNTYSKIDRLLDSSIYSFKIEGRMKSPLYVGFITNFYRHLINKEEFNTQEELDKLKTIFNREFTIGRMFEEEDNNFMNIISPNHKGLEIGKVLSYDNKKIKIKLNKGYSLNQYDAIRFCKSNKGFIVNYLYDKNDKLVSSITDIGYVDNKVELNEIDTIAKTQDYLLENQYSNLKNKRKIDISFKVIAKYNKELYIEISDGTNTISKKGNTVEKAINSPTIKEDIINKLNRLGDTPFICNNYDIDSDDDIFIPVSELNEIRRNLVIELIEKRENIKKNYIEENVSFKKNNKTNDKYINTYFVRNEKQLETCMNLGESIIYVDDKDIYDKYKDEYDNLYYVIRREKFNIRENLKEKNLVSDYADYNNNVVRGNYTLNVTNIYTAYYLDKIGVNNICLSVELEDYELEEFINLYKEKFGNCNFEILVYGRVENMIIKGNILGIENNNKKYSLIDSKNREFPVYYDGINTHIMNWEHKKLDTKNLVNKCNFRYDFYEEDSSDIEKIVKKI